MSEKCVSLCVAKCQCEKTLCTSLAVLALEDNEESFESVAQGMRIEKEKEISVPFVARVVV